MSDNQSSSLHNEFRDKIESHMGARFVEFPVVTRELPGNIDFDKFPEQDRQIVQDVVIVTNTFIKAPLIIDKFEDHNEREDTRTKLYDDIKTKYGPESATAFNNLVTYNKLKRNCVGTLSMAASLWSLVEPESVSASKISELTNKELRVQSHRNDKDELVVTSDPWSEKSLEEKQKALEQFTNAGIDMLWEIANK